MRLSLVVFVAAWLEQAAGTGYVHFDLERRIPITPNANLRERAPNVVDAQLTQNAKVEYLINVTIGRPGQSLGVTLDTGSSGLWVPSNRFCRTKRCDHGSFNPSSSSTYKTLEAGTFNISYALPGDWDAGDWASDSISIGGISALRNQVFALAQSGYDAHGVMGIGLDPEEPFGPNGVSSYPTILTSMAQNGLVNRRAYSLYLNAYNQTYGSILFGGIDTTKYVGDLVALPLQSGSRNTAASNFWVTLSKVTFTDAAGMKSVLTPEGYAQMVLVDSGTSYTILTNGVMERLANGMGAAVLGSQGSLAVPCKYRNTNATISYTFGGADGPTISVPISDTIATSGQDQCDFAFGPQLGSLVILGDSFLRSAYAVFDVDNHILALAQAVPGNIGTSNVVAIPAGTTLPGVVSTATAGGTSLAATAATQSASIVTASKQGNSIIPGTPTFNLGAVATSTGSTSSATTLSPAALSSDWPVRLCIIAAMFLL